MDTMELEALVAQFKDADVKDDARFSELFSKAYRLLFLADKELAAKFGVSRSTITRWRNGTTTPHSAMRKPIYSFLVSKTNGRIAAGSVAPAAVRSGGVAPTARAVGYGNGGGVSQAPVSLAARSRD